MGFQADEAEHHLDAGGLQRAREADVGFFVEPGAQFHHGGDGFAGLGGLDEGFDDGGVTAGAVEGLLDGDHGGVHRGLAQKLHHDVKAFERMVDQDVLRADGGEAVPGEIAYALGEAGGVGGEEQVRAVVDDELFDVDQADDAGFAVDFASGGLDGVNHQLAQVGGHVGLDGELDGDAAAAAFQRGLVGLHEVFGFFLELHVSVADQAEQAGALQLEAGNRRERNMPTRSSSMTKRMGPPGAVGRRTKRSIWLGSGMRADMWPWSSLRAKVRAMTRPMLGMKGKGCAGSTASGVSTGKTRSMK